ncbi:MAG TPA: hypothetical protein VLZ75_00985 [Chitinophagales bacterium]|nr:hypothetical protein [Chitinophagales bacterium]
MLICFSLKAQNKVLVPIVNHKIFVLDSRSSTIFSGKYSTVIELYLPENTVRWYYRFYNVTKKDLITKYSPKIPFLDEMQSKLNETEFYNFKIPAVPPESANKLNVYLLNDTNQVAIFNKQFTFNKVEYQNQFSVLNAASGWAEVCDPEYLTGSQYLGLMNTANVTSTNVMLDIVAVCNQRSIEDSGWKENDLKSFEVKLMNQLTVNPKIPAQSYQEISSCYLESLQQQVKLSDYNLLSQKDKSSFDKKIFDNCFNENFKFELIDTISTLTPYYIIGKWVTEKDETLEFKYSNELILTKKNATILNGSWYISNNELYMKFENYKTQKYQPVLMTPKKFIWKNSLSDNYLRYSKVNP